MRIKQTTTTKFQYYRKQSVNLTECMQTRPDQTRFIIDSSNSPQMHDSVQVLTHGFIGELTNFGI